MQIPITNYVQWLNKQKRRDGLTFQTKSDFRLGARYVKGLVTRGGSPGRDLCMGAGGEGLYDEEGYIVICKDVCSLRRLRGLPK